MERFPQTLLHKSPTGPTYNFTNSISESMSRRSRNFEGCWTCRLRKIKCDATRPICLRCQKANLQCKGYSIVLAWADSVSLGKNGEWVSVPMARDGSSHGKEGGMLRRNVELVQWPKNLQFESFDHLNRVVLLVDDEARSLDSGAYFQGPFGVYCSEQSERLRPNPADLPRFISTRPAAPRVAPTTHREAPVQRKVPELFSRPPVLAQEILPPVKQPLPPAESNLSLSQFASQTIPKNSVAPVSKAPRTSEALSPLESVASLDFEFQMEQDGPELAIFSRTDNSYVHNDLVDSAKLTILTIKGPNFEFTEQIMFHILYPKFFPNVESDEWRPDNRILLNYFELREGGEVAIKPLLAECTKSLDSSLISFARVIHPNNPWDLHVVPFIKRIIYELVCEDYAGSSDWRTHSIRKSAVQVPRDLLIRNIKLAILCMLLAASAFQKSLTRTKQHVNAVNTYYLDHDMRRSIELRKLGINRLNYHLDEFDNNSEFATDDGYETYLLLAIILQIHLDNACSVFENYDLLFAIGDYIVKRKPKHIISPVARYLRNIFHILNVFFETTQAINFFNYSISEKDRKLKYLDLNANYDLTRGDTSDEKEESDFDDAESTTEGQPKDIQFASLTDQSNPLSFTVYFNKKKLDSQRNILEASSADEATGYKKISYADTRSIASPVTPQIDDPSVYVSYGLPKSLLKLFHEVTQLANHKNVFHTKGVVPRNFPRLCAEVEDKIINWKVEDYWKLQVKSFNPISNATTTKFISQFHEGLFYNVSSFQYALLIFYKRLISEVPIQTYQDLIEKCLDAMERLLKLNEALDGDFSFAPSFWPVLMSGCDIDIPHRVDLQTQCQALWEYDCFKKYNFWRSKQILYEVWSRRKDGETHSFMDMVREWDIVLCLG